MDQEPQNLLLNVEDELQESWQKQIADMYEAIRLVYSKAIVEDYNGFDGRDVVEINKTVLEHEFFLNPHLYGRLRERNVRIVSTIDGKQRESSVKPVDAKELPYIYKNFSDSLKDRTSKISSSSSVPEVLDTASWAHIELIRIHPFLEGNGRTARLLVDLIFARADLPYITDWGSKNREYIETVYETHKQRIADLFKFFLARKLKKSLVALEKEGLGIADYVKSTKDEVEKYMQAYGGSHKS